MIDKGVSEGSNIHFLGLGLYYVGLNFFRLKGKWQGMGLAHF